MRPLQEETWSARQEVAVSELRHAVLSGVPCTPRGDSPFDRSRTICHFEPAYATDMWAQVMEVFSGY